MIYEIDAIGLLCPLPVLKARKALARAATGDEIHLLATDPAAIIDVPHFCTQSGHIFVTSIPKENGVTHYILRAK